MVGLDVASVAVIQTLLLIVFILGMFMDWIGIALLTMVVFMPIVKPPGYGPIWSAYRSASTCVSPS